MHYGRSAMHPSHLLIGKIPVKAFIGTDGRPGSSAEDEPSVRAGPQWDVGSLCLHASWGAGQCRMGGVLQADPLREISGHQSLEGFGISQAYYSIRPPCGSCSMYISLLKRDCKGLNGFRVYGVRMCTV